MKIAIILKKYTMLAIENIFVAKFSNADIIASLFIAVASHSVFTILEKLDINIIRIFITKVRIPEITELSVREDMNIPIEISAPPRRIAPRRAYIYDIIFTVT